jgi:hypothetical protein
MLARGAWTSRGPSLMRMAGLESRADDDSMPRVCSDDPKGTSEGRPGWLAHPCPTSHQRRAYHCSQPLRWQGSVKSGDSSPRIERVVASWTWDIRRVACPASFPGQSPHCACSQPKRLASLRIMICVLSVFMETGSPFAQFGVVGWSAVVCTESGVRCTHTGR